ncbi:MAG: glutamine--fructose-6-phosphate transaminase (isomerizing) [Planctomycetota bacterium]
MCGIVGAFRREGAVCDLIVDGLRTLEYRGYDSAGVAVVDERGLTVRRRAGRLSQLEQLLGDGSLNGASLGIGHTRWATHGPPTDGNAHPHTDRSGRIALVHNGIIENYLELREELAAAGAELRSDTDTEVLAHLIGREVEAGKDLAEAVRLALGRVEGYYAIAVIAEGDDPRLVAARHGPPLCVAVTDDGAWLGSDVLAILKHTREVHYLEDGDIADLAPGHLAIRSLDGSEVTRPAQTISWDAEAAEMGGYPHYMLKEIHEQPDVLARTAAGHIDLDRGDVRFDGELFSDASLRDVSRIQVVACGTALHAGLVASYMLERLAGVPVDVDYASEFRYREPVLTPGTLSLSISQSGETADTLAAQRLATVLGARSATICNSIGSTMVREAEGLIPIDAGPEIGVASTKAFTAMVVAGYLLAIRLGRARGTLDAARGTELLTDLQHLHPKVQQLLGEAEVAAAREAAERHANAKGFLFLGRGINYPIALEGALKLKEISYVHAEGYPAGEMKHGPIALIEPGMSTLVVAARDGVAEKVLSNIEQVKARGGEVVCVGADPACLEVADERLPVPECSEWLAPLLNVLPLQLFSYYVALAKGCDIDKPRNLAKSVTVE